MFWDGQCLGSPCPAGSRRGLNLFRCEAHEQRLAQPALDSESKPKIEAGAPRRSARLQGAGLARIAEHLQHALVKIPNRAFEVEVGENDRAHHATVEIGRDELRHAVGVHRFEHALPDALANDPRQELALLDVETLDRGGDVGIGLVRPPEIQGDFHKAMDFGKFVDMVREPGRDDRRRIGASVVESAHVLKGTGDRVLDRRPEQVRLAVEVVIDERGIDLKSLGDVLDGHRGEVALGEKIERGSQELVADAVLVAPGACGSSPANGPPTTRLALDIPIQLVGHLPFSSFAHRSDVITARGDLADIAAPLATFTLSLRGAYAISACGLGTESILTLSPVASTMQST